MYDPTTDTKFPTGMRTVTFRRPSWSHDGSMVFLEVAKWQPKPANEKKPAGANAKDVAKDDDEPVGAAITNLVSNYGSHHFSSGIAETDHIETGQQRMEVPIYEDLQAYIRNSAVYNVHNMKTPLLLETGDNDGTVFWHQAVELYNIARRAKKDVVMLVYGGEDHGLRKKANQMDYHRRIHEWFGHYLKGDPAPAWITKGKSFLEREQELKPQKQPGPITP